MTEQSGSRTLQATALVEHGYHELGFWYPVLRLRELGAHVSVAGPRADHTYMSVLGYPVIPDEDFSAAAKQEPDLLITPGGEAARRLATSELANALIRDCEARGHSVISTGDPDALPGLVATAAAIPDRPHLQGRRVLVLAESRTPGA